MVMVRAYSSFGSMGVMGISFSRPPPSGGGGPPEGWWWGIHSCAAPTTALQAVPLPLAGEVWRRKGASVPDREAFLVMGRLFGLVEDRHREILVGDVALALGVD